MQQTEVLIIGAGMAGASAAYFLAPHKRVVLLERELHVFRDLWQCHGARHHNRVQGVLSETTGRILRLPIDEPTRLTDGGHGRRRS